MMAMMMPSSFVRSKEITHQNISPDCDVEVTIFLISKAPESTHAFGSSRIHFLPKDPEQIYELSNGRFLERFRKVAHVTHLANLRSISKDNKFLCEDIADQSIFTLKQLDEDYLPNEEWKQPQVLWFGPYPNERAKVYGPVSFSTDVSHLYVNRCHRCYDFKFARRDSSSKAEGLPLDDDCDGCHYFLSEIIQFLTQTESRILVSRDPTPPHPHCTLYSPGRKTGPWTQTNESDACLSKRIPMVNHSEVPVNFQHTSIRHSVAFMLEEGCLPRLNLIRLGLLHHDAAYKNCLKAKKQKNGKCQDVKFCGRNLLFEFTLLSLILCADNFAIVPLDPETLLLALKEHPMSEKKISRKRDSTGNLKLGTTEEEEPAESDMSEEATSLIKSIRTFFKDSESLDAAQVFLKLSECLRGLIGKLHMKDVYSDWNLASYIEALAKIHKNSENDFLSLGAVLRAACGFEVNDDEDCEDGDEVKEKISSLIE